MRRILTLTVIMSLMMAGCFAFAYNQAARAAEPPELKYSTHDPLQANTMVDAYIPWINKMNSDARGAFKIKIYPGGVLGRDPRTQIKLLKDGVTDIAVVTSLFYPKRFPDATLFNIPFVINGAVEGSLAAWNMLCKGLLQGYDDLKVLSLSTTDVHRIHTNYPVRKLDDVKGHRFRVSGGLAPKLLSTLGATPVAMPIPQTAENMSRGVVDGVLCDTNALFVFRINEVAKYYLDIPMGTSVQAIVMDRKVYEALPPQGKLAIDMNIGRPIILSVSNVMKGESDKCLTLDPDAHVYVPEGQVLGQWKAAAEKIKADWIKETPNGQELYDALEKELKWIRSGGIDGAP